MEQETLLKQQKNNKNYSLIYKGLKPWPNFKNSPYQYRMPIYHIGICTQQMVLFLTKTNYWDHNVKIKFVTLES
ncbi:hypothetical protein DHC50_03480 [Arenibacter sp. A80]|nr:hypothetical protein [Arenibacter sp. A80]RFT58215.1 hypothetical protein D0S24_03480 [Arenibacter sp. P308M17]